jgi:two-component system cell cycle sensor histidine kinase/response regulator CckA
MLEKLGYKVVAARTPGEAIHLAQEHAGEIHLLVTDVVMPEMNGRDLAKNILSIYPNLKRLFMSGYTANVIAHHGVLDEGVNFIQKPFSRAQLGAKVREALGSNFIRVNPKVAHNYPKVLIPACTFIELNVEIVMTL